MLSFFIDQSIGKRSCFVNKLLPKNDNMTFKNDILMVSPSLFEDNVMAHTNEQVLVGRVVEYDPAIIAEVGELMPQLDPSFPSTPMTQDVFERRFTGPDRALLIARTSRVVGTAVMHAMHEQAEAASTGYLGGFVVDENARGTGVATALWHGGIEQYCRDQGLPAVALNTETDRAAAIQFYEKMKMAQVAGTVGHYTKELGEQTTVTAVPQEVVEGFFGPVNVVSGRLGEGLFNDTFIAQVLHKSGGTTSSVLQRINGGFDGRLVKNNAAVSERLATAGWEVPQTLTTLDGGQAMRDRDGRLWRQLSHIESDGSIPEHLTPETLGKIGGLLGQLHKTLRTLDYEPSSVIPHFHDTTYYMSRLEQLQPQLSGDAEVTTFANKVLQSYHTLPPLPATGSQIIHGDPQLTNILFRDSEPFTYIDFDTVMEGTIWMDIGDLLRATLEDDAKHDRPLGLEKLRPIAEGYRQAMFPDMDSETFYTAALTATQLISLELAARFTNDIRDDNYFAWDTGRFASRRDNHLYRAGIQWDIYQALERIKPKDEQ
jgi:Ser/Thr protein kinase RdoA (MazF antagonist)/GNAT superfamily N-acetyltransferase